MPYYDFYCQDCRRKVTLFYRSFAVYGAADRHTCPRCQGTNLHRWIRRVHVARSEEARMFALTDETALSQLDDADPAAMAAYMRRVSREMGEDLGDEFGEVVDRLESGESPESIEASLPDLPGDDAGADDFGPAPGGLPLD